MYEIVYTKKAISDIEKIKAAKLDKKVKQLIEVVRKNPYKNPPPYEKLVGNLYGMLSRRIIIKHRFVYEVNEEKKSLKSLACGHIMIFNALIKIKKVLPVDG